VAELSCLHNQHVRHRPPFQERSWVLSEAGRDSRIGADIDCPLCDRAELPTGLRVVRTAGPFDEASLPAGLRRAHRVAEGTWGRLQVADGSLVLTMESTPPLRAPLRGGESHPIPPGVPHALLVDGPVRLTIDFLVKGEGPSPREVERGP
jgi:tellurite methyltransferase